MKESNELLEQENLGMHLLEKGREGLLRMVFSRFGLVFLLFVVQLGLLLTVMLQFRDYILHYLGIFLIFSAVMIVVLLNSNKDPTSKITWLMVILLMPAFGALLYIYMQTDLGHRVLKKRVSTLIDESWSKVVQIPETKEGFSEAAPEARGIANYLRARAGHPVFDKTAVKYYSLGEDVFADMLEELEQAKEFIFLEYFIIKEGLMWGRILEILARKAKEGVEVRVMYDGSCEFTTLPHDYPKHLAGLGIKCKAFAPMTPFVSTYYNYRDHRKIMVIDGHTAFTGGVNLSDEYINHVERFGHWKDTALMLKGDAVKSFTLLFLQLWNVNERSIEFDRFLSMDSCSVENAAGYVIPYGDCPLDDDRVGERVYMDILNRAQKYVHIMSPYLILDGEMETALKFAAERGIDVRIILPGIPDKKGPYALAKTHYASLIRSGVKVFEYKPGFVHSKTFVCDDREAVVGTINLDYRSLYHHFECAAYMYGTDCIGDMERDFLDTQSKCVQITPEAVKNEKWIVKLLGQVLKAIAPLL